MAERKNKFDAVVEQLDAQEEVDKEKSDKVVKKISGQAKKKTEERKVLPTYIPMSLYEQFDEITTAYGISNNAAICQLIRDYVTEKKGVLNEI